jgi:hypothetical protein
VHVDSIRAALDALDPGIFAENRERWLAYLNAAKAIGAPVELLAEWCARNPAYERNDREIERNIASLRGLHSGAWYAELKRAGIKFRHTTPTLEGNSPEVPASRRQHPSTIKPRIDAILRTIARARGANREPCLFWGACAIAEIIVERKLSSTALRSLLADACRDNGLWSDLGAEGCKQTIANAFDHIGAKQ